jgi:hypothetical protein
MTPRQDQRRHQGHRGEQQLAQQPFAGTQVGRRGHAAQPAGPFGRIGHQQHHRVDGREQHRRAHAAQHAAERDGEQRGHQHQRMQADAGEEHVHPGAQQRRTEHHRAGQAGPLRPLPVAEQRRRQQHQPEQPAQAAEAADLARQLAEQRTAQQQCHGHPGGAHHHAGRQVVQFDVSGWR